VGGSWSGNFHDWELFELMAMVETESERTRAFTGGKTFEGYALYDTVRIKIVDDMHRAMLLKEKIMRDGRVEADELAMCDLKALLIGVLYEWVEPKLDYPQYKEKFVALRPLLDPYALGGRDLNLMGPREAFRALRLIRQFIEVDGPTKYEQEKDNIPKTDMKARNADGVLHAAISRNVEVYERKPSP
jgi:hypothetical protein